MTVVWSCNEYVCYTVHYMEKLKQRVFLKNWLIVDITFWTAYRCTSLCQKARKQKTPNCNHFDVGKKSCAGVGLNFQIKQNTSTVIIAFFLLSTDSILKLQCNTIHILLVIINLKINRDILILLASLIEDLKLLTYWKINCTILQHLIRQLNSKVNFETQISRREKCCNIYNIFK